jgi:hypothetical protein
MSDEYRVVGTGLTVFQDDSLIEGRAVWLDSPEAVLDFVDRDDVEECIAVARGGTTTFLTPALVAGVRGVITLQGAPTSHLGIVSREYGIPCLMSVAFDEGVRSDRGEAIPPDGAVLRLDVSNSPNGAVLVPVGVSLGEAAAADGADPEAEAAAAEAAAVLAHQIAIYRGEIDHGPSGERQMRERMKTDVLTLTKASLEPDRLTLDEVNDLISFCGWSNWDMLAARATEGESGLIPRQQYESLGIMQFWHGLPKWWRLITEEIGADGVRELGAIGRREVGTKVNLLHIYVNGAGPASGRGIALALGHHSASARGDDFALSWQFHRRLYSGLWDDEGPMYPCNRGFRAPVLESDWIERFQDERTPLEDPEHLQAFQKFNGGTEILAFLLHFDNRLGLGDTGPYPLPGGGWMIVRDHIINDPIYEWAEECAGLPFAITLAMTFSDEPPLTIDMTDLGNIWAHGANYLRNLTGYAVYVRDRHDTPISELRRIDEAEMADLLARAEQASSRLYARIARMSYREKIMAGVLVYYIDWVAAMARPIGLWDKFVRDYDAYAIDPLTLSAYEPLVEQRQAEVIVPPLFITGSGFQPLEA